MIVFTVLYCLAMTAATAVAVRDARGSSEPTPTAFVDLWRSQASRTGFLGTAIGLGIGLLGMDIASIDFQNFEAAVAGLTGGIAVLMGGLGTAIWTTVVGVLATLILRWMERARLFHQKIQEDEREAQEAFNGEDLQSLLQAIRDNTAGLTAAGIREAGAEFARQIREAGDYANERIVAGSEHFQQQCGAIVTMPEGLTAAAEAVLAAGADFQSKVEGASSEAAANAQKAAEQAAELQRRVAALQGEVSTYLDGLDASSIEATGNRLVAELEVYRKVLEEMPGNLLRSSTSTREQLLSGLDLHNRGLVAELKKLLEGSYEPAAEVFRPLADGLRTTTERMAGSLERLPERLEAAAARAEAAAERSVSAASDVRTEVGRLASTVGSLQRKVDRLESQT